MRQIREAIPGKIALYSEFVPSDVSCQYEDGAFYYGVLSGYLGSPDFWISQVHPETSSEQVAPHYLNIARFAFPDFKVFHIVYSMPHVNGNWSLIKFPFFNGDAYYHKTGTPFNSDDHAKAFYRRVFAVQHAHRDAFTSGNVGPLVRTEAPDLFANRFSARGKTVWTLYNANRRTLRGLLLTVEHHPGATYTDAWAGAPVTADVKGSRAALTFEIGPRSVGCIVQQWDHDAR